MPRCVLAVEAAGPMTTFQDAGRFGHLRRGVTHSGPVDRLGFAAANIMAGNAAGATAIELSHGGIGLRCIEGTTGFALAGGDFTASLDGAGLGNWVAGALRPGERLTIRSGELGNWATLAFGGRLECPHWLGSAATLALVAALPGLGGGRLAAGDTLVIDAQPVTNAAPRSFAPPAPKVGPIRIITGPQAHWFAPETLALLLAGAFTIAPAFDRMGAVLAGPPLPPLALTMLSSPLLRGAIQVNGAGTATVLLADHQTTGGYPRIASVISADLDRVAQLGPGADLRFSAVEVEAATALARTAADCRAAFLAGLASAQGSLAERLMRANLIDGVSAGDE